MRSNPFHLAAARIGGLAALSLATAALFATPAMAAPAMAADNRPLTLAQALQIAEHDAPALRAAAAAADSARQFGRAAGQLPDPVLSAGIESLPIEGPNRFSLGADFMTARRIAVMQEYVSPQKRAARGRRGEDEAGRESAVGQLARSQIRAEVAAAWIDRHYAQRAGSLLAELSSELSMQQRATQAQLAAGRASAADVLAIQAMLAVSQDRALVAVRQQDAATARLARWIGAAASRPSADEPMLDGGAFAHMAGFDLDAHPQVRVADAELAVARRTLAVAQQDRQPNWTWGVAYAQRGSAFENMVSFEVSVPLPIAPAARQDREVAARIALVEQAQQRLEDVRRQSGSDFESIRIEFQTFSDRRRQLESTLLKFHRQRVEAVLGGYGSGQQPLAQVLEARRAELDARLQVLDIERDAARAWARLTHLYLDPGRPQAGDPQGAVQ
jgi:outer membrane protein TolC